MYDLKEIFRAITPDNIKDTPITKDSMDIFIDIIKERSKQSIDLSSYTENKEIRRELFKTYLGDLYDVLDGIKDNQKIIDLIRRRNEIYKSAGESDDFEFISSKVLEEMINRISDEHFVAFRSFREKKGTIKGIEYIFHLIATLINAPEGIDYIIIEGENPFELAIEGTLPPEFYYFLIAPLAHPAGFTYSYAQSVIWELIDYFFPIEIQYTVKQLRTNCINTDPVTGAKVNRTYDFSDRKVIDVKVETFTWPRATKIYFGGEHLGEYLENLVYSDGNSTVELKNEDGVIQELGEFCTLVHVIEKQIIEDPDFDKMISALEFPFDVSHYNHIWDPVSGALIPSDDTIVKDYISIGEEHAQPRTPYLSWDRAPFFSSIGYDPYKWDTWNGRGYPDSGIITRISQSTDKVYSSGLGLINPNTPLIGDSHIWGKHEFTLGQSLNEFISDDIPQRVNSAEIGTTPGNDILYGKDSYLGKETILTQPGRPRLDQAYISGDAFHMTYVSKSTEISGFIVRDDLGAYIVPDVFELENSNYTGSDKVDDYSTIPFHEDSYTHLRSYGTDCDKTIRINSFIVQDDEYSFVLFNDATSENITRPENIQIAPEWSLGGGLGKASGSYLIGDEINCRVPKWDIPRLRDSFFDIGIYNKIGITRYDIKLDNHYGSRDTLIGNRTNILGEYELIGGTEYSSLVPGFWNNGFHQLSDEFEFGVFRGDKWLPDNNANKPVITNVNDNYSQSLENGNIVNVFGDNSDKLIITDEVSYKDDYEISFDTERGLHRFFTEHSDKLSTGLFFSNISEDYELSYGDTIYISDRYALSEYVIGGEGENRFFTERADKIGFGITYLSNEDYSTTFESYYLIGSENSLGVLNDYRLGLIGERDIGEDLSAFAIGFSEQSDMYCSFNTFDSDNNPVPNYIFRTKEIILGDSDYRETFNKLLLIGSEYIGENLINPDQYLDAFTEKSDIYEDSIQFSSSEDYSKYLDEVLFDENSDSADYLIQSSSEDDYSISTVDGEVIGTELIGSLEINPIAYVEEFDENSDFMATGLFTSEVNPRDIDKYEESVDKLMVIGNEIIGEVLIEPYSIDIVFDEDSDDIDFKE